MSVEQMNVSQKGKVSYNKAILLSIVNLATKEVDGVARLYSNFKGAKFGRVFTKNYYEGVKINHTNDGAIIDVYIKVYSSFNVADVACKVQENIKNSITSMTEASVKSINVHVLGVDFSNLEQNPI